MNAPSRSLLAAAVLALAFALPASAGRSAGGTVTGAQDPHLVVTLTAKVAGKTLQVVTVTGSIQNTTKAALPITVTATLTGPLGNSGSTTSTTVLGAKKKLASSYTIAVKPTDPRGTYTVTLTAAEAAGASTASLPILVK